MQKPRQQKVPQGECFTFDEEDAIPSCDVLRAACTCHAGLGLQGKGKCSHVGGVIFAMEDFSRRGYLKQCFTQSLQQR